MDEKVKEYLEKYPAETVELFLKLRHIVFDSAPCEPKEILWAKMPSYYVGESFVRLIAFSDHVNVEARAVSDHKAELSGYKITPKGMLQIYLRQEIPTAELSKIFFETLK